MSKVITQKIKLAMCKECDIKKAVPLTTTRERCKGCKVMMNIIIKEVEMDVEEMVRQREMEAQGKFNPNWNKDFY
ncbi:hypothetical protein HQ529_03550 [Candidatus Woesearchaeota archaeon]|nr:hypothetical protein [Candidatus Woesearchaeota archaeon]